MKTDRTEHLEQQNDKMRKRKRIYNLQYYAKNKERINKSKRERYGIPEVCMAQRLKSAGYYIKNREIVVQAQREYYSENRERILEESREFHRQFGKRARKNRAKVVILRDKCAGKGG